MEKAQKIYCGSGKTKGEGWLQVSVNPEILSQHVQEYNGKKYVKLNINIGKEDKFGKDVQITIDTWKPTPKANTFTKSVADDNTDLPF
jgi:ribosomal protein S19